MISILNYSTAKITFFIEYITFIGDNNINLYLI